MTITQKSTVVLFHEPSFSVREKNKEAGVLTKWQTQRYRSCRNIISTTIKGEAMLPKRMCLMVALMGLLSGCASTLSKSIEQRMAISEQCRLATSALPPRFKIPEAFASIQLGNVGKCSLDQTQTLLPMCSVDQIMSKYIKPRQPDPIDSAKTTEEKEIWAAREARWTAVSTAVNALRDDFKDLAESVAAIDSDIKKLNDDDADAPCTQPSAAGAMAPLSRYDTQTRLLQTMQCHLTSVREKLTTVRTSQYQLRRAVQLLGAELEPAARIELEAWDMNLRIHLTRFEEVLSGSHALAVREGVKDLVMTHVARRTLEMLHNSLKTADAVLRQLDEKAYGAVSIGYLAFGPDLQDAVTAAFASIQASFQVREQQRNVETEMPLNAPQFAGPVSATQSGAEALLTRPVLRELRRAACENLVQGTQFSMLTELIDTMIILQVQKNDPILTQLKPLPPIVEKSSFLESTPEGDGTNTDGIALSFVAHAHGTSVAAAEIGQGQVMPMSTVTPAGVHMTNAWTARQQMLAAAISAKRQTGAGVPNEPLNGVDLVDENTVQQLADVATAKVIDDAVRLSPGTLAMRGAEVSNHISSNVSVVTAATAVSQASVTLKLNLSVSNVNNFTPTNYNNVTPVINLAVPAPASGPGTGPSAAAPSLCADPSLARAGADCTRTADGYVITFARSFRGDSCLASELEPALTALGRGLAAYRARHGLEHMATVEGYASVLPATLAGCKAAAIAPESACTYSNKLRKDYTMAGCEGPSADRNVVLSAARAKHAARVLETAARGALVVDTLLAKGTQTAQADGPAARDQTILVRLFPRKAN
ncbi:hypothetical protein LK540_03250 [Massilia sp. IC2-278]|uniref:hypothetical protein n=1 Tax=Massilia sp. IC2-278 TaxID=2887200 RepID=UPI001E48DD29|nr:hypothetical protein [Massilia sp. IC2-278]MCC2959442.1 hypothetical protein [Massilia sp. IC2-278]